MEIYTYEEGATFEFKIKENETPLKVYAHVLDIKTGKYEVVSLHFYVDDVTVTCEIEKGTTILCNPELECKSNK